MVRRINPPRGVATHKFRGKRYRIVHERAPGPAGASCDDPAYHNPALTFRNRAPSALTELIWYLHESLHACLWDLDEDTVRQTAEDVGRFIRRIGYERSDPDD